MAPSLPSNPSLEQLKKQAKDLLKAHKAGDASCCAVLRKLNRFTDAGDSEILTANIPLKEVQFALAMDYGFKSWVEMKAFIESLETMRSGGLPLSKSAYLSKWVVDPEDLNIDGDTWVFTGKDVRAEVGGMSWDNYVLDADIWTDRTGPDAHYCVQFTARGTSIYCQLVPGYVVIAYYEEEPKDNPKGFTHLIAPAEVRVRDRTWFNFRMVAEAGAITAFLDGQKIVSATIPCGTQGMPGLLVNQQNDAEVRVRNIRVAFLRPTPEQLSEYGTDANANWARYVAEHGVDMPDTRRPGDR